MTLIFIRRAFILKKFGCWIQFTLPKGQPSFFCLCFKHICSKLVFVFLFQVFFFIVFISPPFLFPLNSHENINIEFFDESKCIEVFQKLKHKCFIQLFPLSHMKTKGKSLSQLENQIANLTCVKLNIRTQNGFSNGHTTW